MRGGTEGTDDGRDPHGGKGGREEKIIIYICIYYRGKEQLPTCANQATGETNGSAALLG